MKAILLSIRPEWVAKILNGEKTIEVRKKFPKDYVGWVYIYCCKEHNYKDLLVHNTSRNLIFLNKSEPFYKDDWERTPYLQILNGKVVARFWCDKVSGIWKTTTSVWLCETEMSNKLYEKSCLSDIELDRYFKPKALGFRYTYGYAIHISKLEIFDKPRELSEFYTNRLDEELTKRFDNSIQLENGKWVKPITKAPQNYCYVEGEQK